MGIFMHFRLLEEKRNPKPPKYAHTTLSFGFSFMITSPLNGGQNREGTVTSYTPSDILSLSSMAVQNETEFVYLWLGGSSLSAASSRLSTAPAVVSSDLCLVGLSPSRTSNSWASVGTILCLSAHYVRPDIKASTTKTSKTLSAQPPQNFNRLIKIAWRWSKPTRRELRSGFLYQIQKY